MLSLLARRTFLPDFAAWKVDLIPAKPEMAEIMISTSFELKISESSLSSSQMTDFLVFRIFTFADLSFIKMYFGLYFQIIWLAFSTFLLTEIPTNSNFSLFESITDRAFSPILPEAPRIKIFFKSMILPYLREVRKIKSLV